MTDFDGDGLLDLLVAHGESASQPISVFKVTQVCQKVNTPCLQTSGPHCLCTVYIVSQVLT